MTIADTTPDFEQGSDDRAFIGHPKGLGYLAFTEACERFSYYSMFVGSVAMGWVGSFYDQMSPAAFWTLDAAIGFGGALLVLILHRPLANALEPTTA